jgi:hypothetical protein
VLAGLRYQLSLSETGPKLVKHCIVRRNFPIRAINCFQLDPGQGFDILKRLEYAVDNLTRSRCQFAEACTRQACRVVVVFFQLSRRAVVETNALFDAAYPSRFDCSFAKNLKQLSEIKGQVPALLQIAYPQSFHLIMIRLTGLALTRKPRL